MSPVGREEREFVEGEGDYRCCIERKDSIWAKTRGIGAILCRRMHENASCRRGGGGLDGGEAVTLGAVPDNPQGSVNERRVVEGGEEAQIKKARIMTPNKAGEM